MVSAQETWELLGHKEKWEEQADYKTAHEIELRIINQSTLTASLGNCLDLMRPILNNKDSILDTELNDAALYYHLFRLFELLSNHENKIISEIAGRLRNHLIPPSF